MLKAIFKVLLHESLKFVCLNWSLLDLYRKNSLELIELSNVNKVSLV
jgi:hypothetical protein